MEQKSPADVKSVAYQPQIGIRGGRSVSSLRVLAVFFHPDSRVTAVGGAERRFVEILRVLSKKNDLHTTVIESAPSIFAERGIFHGTCLISLRFKGKGWLSTYLEWFFWIAKCSFKIFPVICHFRPHVIYVANNTLPNLILGMAAGIVSRRPVCVVVHHIDVTSPESLREKSLYFKYRALRYGRLVSFAKALAFCLTVPILRKAKGIIVVSNFTARALRNSGVSSPELFVSGNAVDIKLIGKAKPIAETANFDGVFVGRIAREKGVFDLVRVWKKVTDIIKNAKLLVIGDGLEMASLKKEIARSGLEDKILVRGRCGESELYSLLKSSRVFIFPSLFEGWGIAVAEALACGLPVVAYDISALREVFGKCASVFLAPTKDIDGMASNVLRLLNMGNEELRRLGNVSRYFSGVFNWEKIAQKDLEFLSSLRKT